MKINVTPYLFISLAEIRNWENFTIREIAIELENLRVKAKEAVNYFWDNTHFVVNSRDGKPALTIQPSYHESMTLDEAHISLWNYKTDTAMPDIKGPTMSFMDIMVIEGYLENIQMDKIQCCECEMWFEEENMEHYSYAGIVCHGCYDINKHLPPETD